MFNFSHFSLFSAGHPALGPFSQSTREIKSPAGARPIWIVGQVLGRLYGAMNSDKRAKCWRMHLANSADVEISEPARLLSLRNHHANLPPLFGCAELRPGNLGKATSCRN